MQDGTTPGRLPHTPTFTSRQGNDGSCRSHPETKTKKKKLPVGDLLDHADIVAADRDGDGDDALVELDRDLFLG